jgi:hypothetical protein
MMALIQGSDFDDLFRSFTRSAVRLETRQVYTTEEEREPLRRFLASEAIPLDWFTPWLDDVSAATEAGRQFRRVRIFTEPLTDYLRFELWTCQFNVAAGEDILYLQLDRATALNLPAYDYWLFDDERLALMYFTGDGAPLGAQLVTDPAVVRSHSRWLELAASAAIPYERFAATHPVEAVLG